MGQFHLDPATYLSTMRDAVHDYDELQEAVAAAAVAMAPARVLDLGTGTGETARRVVGRLPQVELVGVDQSESMLALAGELGASALVVGRLEDPLPGGRFDVVISALAVHHLGPAEKRTLFARVHGALAPGGRFVLGDVVVPLRSQDATSRSTPSTTIRTRRPISSSG